MKAEKYEKVEKLEAGAVSVSQYAKANNIKSPAYVQVKYNRYLAKPTKCAYPGYKIVNWQGINFVIPD